MDWADWCRESGTQLGYSNRSPVIGRSNGDDFESLLQKTRAVVCRIIDTAIDDLPTNQCCAIQHRYLASVYRFRDYAQALDAAQDRLMLVLPKMGVVID